MTPDPDTGGLLVYGEAANNTGSTQEITTMLGDFYDSQGDVIADANAIIDHWPVSIVPSGGRVPFELRVSGIREAAGFELVVDAQPTTQTVRQDFEFSALSQSTEGELYCLAGTLRNPGGAIQTYLTVAAILWDSQDNMISWESYDVRSPEDVVGDHTTDFKICISPPNQGAVHYELRAWGN